MLWGAWYAKRQLIEAVCSTWVRKVVKNFEGVVRGICQNLEFASSLLNTLVPDNWARVSSTVGKGWTFLRTFALSDLRSTQIQIAPFFLGTMTMPAHHSVGWSTREITPRDSILSNSCWTLARNASGTCCGVNIACGVASGFSWMLYSSPRLPRPWKSDGNCFGMSFSETSVSVSTLTAKISAVIVGKPSRLVLSPSTTKTD